MFNRPLMRTVPRTLFRTTHRRSPLKVELKNRTTLPTARVARARKNATTCVCRAPSRRSDAGGKNVRHAHLVGRKRHVLAAHAPSNRATRDMQTATANRRTDARRICRCRSIAERAIRSARRPRLSAPLPAEHLRAPLDARPKLQPCAAISVSTSPTVQLIAAAAPTCARRCQMVNRSARRARAPSRVAKDFTRAVPTVRATHRRLRAARFAPHARPRSTAWPHVRGEHVASRATKGSTNAAPNV